MYKYLICMTLLIVSCATGYQKASVTGGYSETQYKENVFEVNYKSNGYTTMEKNRDFLLLRASELALINGYSHFVVIESNNEYLVKNYTSPVKKKTEGKVSLVGETTYNNNTAFTSNSTTSVYGKYEEETTYSGGETTKTYHPRSRALIECQRFAREDIFSYNAKFLYRSLIKKYDLMMNPEVVEYYEDESQGMAAPESRGY